MNRTMTAALCGIVLTAVSGSAMAQRDRLSAQDRLFMRKVSEGNVAEIKTARLALNRTRSSDVKMVANMIIKGHTQSQNELAYLAKTKQVSIPKTPNAMHRREYAMLSRRSGAAFDKAYLKGQVRDHYATVQLFNRETTIGQDSSVRGFANKYLPDVQAHTVMIDKSASSRGVYTPSKFASKMPANHNNM